MNPTINRYQRATLSFSNGSAFVDEGLPPIQEVPTPNNGPDVSDIERDILKVRHLNRDERRYLHNPATDYVESKRGDVLKNACTLEVDDILSKHGIA